MAESSPSKKIRFDTTVRLDLLVTITIMILGAVVFGSNLVLRVEGLEDNQQRTTKLLGDIEKRVRDNERAIDRSHPTRTVPQ